MHRRAARGQSLRLGPEVTRQIERAVLREWLVTNGRGDYACGTVAGPNTRREHGLFIADRGPACPAMLILAGLDTTIEREGEIYPLSCHQYRDVRHPEGYLYCTEFRAWPCPEWRFDLGGVRLVFRILLPRRQRVVICTWTIEDAPTADVLLKVRPLFAFRDISALTQANTVANLSTDRRGEAIRLAPYAGCPEAFVHAPGGEFLAEPCWYNQFLHPWDVALGREGIEDLFSPGVFAFRLSSGKRAHFAVSLEERLSAPLGDIEAEELRRIGALRIPVLEDDPLGASLALAAEAFIVEPEHEPPRIVTGYPVPARRLRDTFIALPGLLLCTRRLDEARAILLDGLRLLSTEDTPLDDVPLWFIRAAEMYVDHSRDWDFLRDTLAPGADAILQRYLNNSTGRGFRQDADGLLRSTDPAEALTWMDSRIGGWPVTPRTGKPVEVNALWHHALGLMARWMRRRGDSASEARYAYLQELCAKSFRQRFWNPSLNALYDVVDAGDDMSTSHAIRPNQIFAVALPSDLLDRAQAASVLRFVENRLLTPMGLRTLSLEDRAFRPRYAGSDVERAGALHEGSVFPWLLGPYVDAVLRVYGRTRSALARAQQSLDPILAGHLADGCVGHVSELFDGAAPHLPAGAIADARATGEMIRARIELESRMC